MNRSTVSRKSLMVRAGCLVFGLLTLAMIALTLVSDRGWLEVQRKAGRLAALQEQAQAIENDNDAIMEEIRRLRQDPDAIERRAREDLKLVRPGEVILVVPEAE